MKSESQFSLDLALSWCLNAKNSLANVHGFSPFQVTLPSTFIDKPTAMTSLNTSKILTDNLLVLHKAREAFTAFENSEKISHALSNNIRRSRETKYAYLVIVHISKEQVISDGKDLEKFWGKTDSRC